MSIPISLDNLVPKEVFQHFYEISQIPRGSKKEKGISDYILKYAKNKGFEVKQDNSFNLLITKPGTVGCENLPAVILQAHMDMVWKAEEGYTFDFETMPIKIIRDGNILKADRTTLGADDGIGVSYIMALMDSTDIPHPPLEFLLTTQEELGMGGAKEFDVKSLKGKTFINIDSEDEGIFCSSCCGGLRIYIKLPVQEIPIERIPDYQQYTFIKLEVKNLIGGHSGTEIDKERGNSNRLMGRFLYTLKEKFQYYLASITGGTALNAISDKTEVTILIKKSDKELISELVEKWNAIFRNELKNSDCTSEKEKKEKNFLICSETELCRQVLTQEVLEKVIIATTLFPHGVAAMDLNLTKQRIPETSDNFAMIEMKNDGNENSILFSSNIRSSVLSKKEFIRNQFITISQLIGATYWIDGEYPAWVYNPDSHIRSVFIKAFQQCQGKEPKVEGIHAGLECGIFSDHFKSNNMDVDLIAFGPNIFGAHTSNEHVEIDSVERNWTLLKKVLKMLSEEKEN